MVMGSYIVWCGGGMVIGDRARCGVVWWDKTVCGGVVEQGIVHGVVDSG